MNLHEYQAKKIFGDYGLPVPHSIVVKSEDEAAAAFKRIAGSSGKVVVKAQIHAGGRGKAGAVKLFDNEEGVRKMTRELLGSRVVTYQTDSDGQPVTQMLVEETCDIAKEYYLGAVIDRTSRLVTFMASTEGGVEIEEVAQNTPEKIHTISLDPLLGIMPYQAREIALKLGFSGPQFKQMTKIVYKLGEMFLAHDFSLLEINPLVLTKKGEIVCLDGKINVDDNALYRQHEMHGMRDESQENPMENMAHMHNLNYIALDGEIGCMVNGAGLAMATMDIIKYCGGNPANFLDVGGTATAERVAEALKIITSSDNVKVVFVNIFGGIVRCDIIANGIIQAVREVGIDLPLVVRLEGNRAEEAAAILAKSGLNLTSVSGFLVAAETAVKLAQKD